MTENTMEKIREYRTSGLEFLRDNLLSVALIGAGTTLMLKNIIGNPSEESTYGFERAGMDAAETGRGKLRGKLGAARKSVRERAGDLQQRAGDIRERAGNIIEQTSSRAREVGEEARIRASRIGSQARIRSEQTGRNIFQALEENPMTALFASFFVGAVVGFLLPETRRERQMMGDMRDRMVERAEETGQEALRRTQRVAEEAKKAAMEETEKQLNISERPFEEAPGDTSEE